MAKIVLCLFYGIFLTAAGAAEFFVDPQLGAPSNDGSAARPWKSLQDLLDRGWIESRGWDALPYNKSRKLVTRNPGAPVKAGDTIRLRSGNHGRLSIRGYYNSDFITLAAAEGHEPRFHSIEIVGGALWAFRGLHVSPEFGEEKKPRTLIALRSHGHHGPVRECLIENCALQSTKDSTSWTAKDWNDRACNGISVDGTKMTIRRNRLLNVNTGIDVGASHSLIEHNSVTNFSGDGLRGLGDHSVFQFNVVKNCYDVNDNHDDGFQSWSSGKSGVGSGEVRGIVLRGNTIVNYEDPGQPHRGPLQGIGCFDGMYMDWLVENNVIVVDHYHGITLLGAVECAFINNTVVDLNDTRPGPASIRVANHKDGRDSSHCTIRNNLATGISVPDVVSMIEDHNFIVKDLDAVFVNAAGCDLRLKPGSPAIDAGSPDSVPATDIAGTPRPQGKGFDIGAFEFQGDSAPPR